MRSCGTLLHITSLPSKYGIGTLGKEAFHFIDFLKESGQSYWQILPVGPTSIGDSPYQSFSAFAGNPLMIDLEELIEEGLLKKEEIKNVEFGEDPCRVNYQKQFEGKYPVFFQVFQKFKEKKKYLHWENFQKRNKEWLEDYTLFMALKYHFEQKPWTEWPEDIRKRESQALGKWRGKLKEEMQYWSFVQYLFFSQWNKMKAYALEQGIRIIGDMPIYVSYDSVDVWAHPEMFELDKELQPVRVAGCPPDDSFSKTGQLWGNPLYAWNYMKKDKYAWWIERIRFSMEMFDTLRIDHFRGFDSYYAIPFEHETAEHGVWVEGPGKALFAEIKKSLGEVSIIAENLGFITESVNQLLKFSGYPGMNVMEYAFSGEEESEDMPHNFHRHSVTYLGTHDNDTCLGYLQSRDEETIQFIQKYLGTDNVQESVWGMIRAAFASVSELVVIQMQDFLEVGTEGRMNYPSTTSGNWAWRIERKDLNSETAEQIKKLSTTYFR